MGVEAGVVGGAAGAGVSEGTSTAAGVSGGAGVGDGVQLIITQIKIKMMISGNRFFTLVISDVIGYALCLIYTTYQFYCQCKKEAI